MGNNLLGLKLKKRGGRWPLLSRRRGGEGRGEEGEEGGVSAATDDYASPSGVLSLFSLTSEHMKVKLLTNSSESSPGQRHKRLRHKHQACNRCS